jgi:hypothetical protein
MADAEPYKVCLDTGSYGTGGQVAAVGLPIVLTLVIVGSFLSWQLKARSALPVARLVPDLEGAVEAPSRVKCLIFNWMPGGLKAPCFTLPFFPKPLEYIGSGVWTGFVFTWPYQPRFAEPLMTNTGRESVALVLIAIQLMFFMGLGGLATAVIEWATESAAGDGSAAADGEAEEENDDKKVYLELALGLCNIYVVSIVQAVFKMVLMMIYGPAAEKGGTYVTGVAVTAAAFFAGCTSSIVSVLNLYSCADFWNVFLFPFLLKQPLSLLAGPLAFIFLVSFGSGASIVSAPPFVFGVRSTLFRSSGRSVRASHRVPPGSVAAVSIAACLPALSFLSIYWCAGGYTRGIQDNRWYVRSGAATTAHRARPGPVYCRWTDLESGQGDDRRRTRRCAAGCCGWVNRLGIARSTLNSMSA